MLFSCTLCHIATFHMVINSNCWSIVFWFCSEITTGINSITESFQMYIFLFHIPAVPNLCCSHHLLKNPCAMCLASCQWGQKKLIYAKITSDFNLILIQFLGVWRRKGCRKWVAGQVSCPGFWTVTRQNIIDIWKSLLNTEQNHFFLNWSIFNEILYDMLVIWKNV